VLDAPTRPSRALAPDLAPVPVQPRRSARDWALIVPAAAVAFGLLLGILLVLNAVRTQLTEQNQRTRLLIQKADPTFQRAPNALDRAAPLLRDAVPILSASRDALPQIRRDARDGRQLVDATRPVVDGLAGLLPALEPLVGDLGPAAADLRPVARELEAADLAGLLAGVSRAAASAETALPEFGRLAREVRRRDLLRRTSRALPNVGRIAELQRAAVQVNRQTLTRTTSIEELFRESLDVQKRILVRVESIDRRLGGARP
jgi:hypothetical protein